MPNMSYNLSEMSRMSKEIEARLEAAKEHPEAVGPDNSYMRGGVTHLGELVQHAPTDLHRLIAALRKAVEQRDLYMEPVINAERDSRDAELSRILGGGK